MAQVWHPRSTGWSLKGEIVYSSSDLLLTNVRCNSHYSYFYALGSSNWHSQRNIGFKALRLVYSVLSCNDAPVGRWGTLLYGLVVASAACTCTFLDPRLVKTASRSCGIEGRWSRSLNPLLLN
jgi:hypothetical protein